MVTVIYAIGFFTYLWLLKIDSAKKSAHTICYQFKWSSHLNPVECYQERFVEFRGKFLKELLENSDVFIPFLVIPPLVFAFMLILFYWIGRGFKPNP